MLQLSPTEIILPLDASRMQQILYNLLSNALKYTLSGGNISVSTWTEEETAVVQVTDSGPGMTVEQQKQAFQLYYRTDEASQSDVQGRGLGLFIVKMLTEAHDGCVELSSQPGEGCCIKVFLPLDG